MKPFLTFREDDEAGTLQYFILQKEFPHWLGRLDTKPIDNVILQVPISGHNLYVTFHATLRGNMMPVYQNVDEEITAVFHNMAEWFYRERILKEPKKYKKWMIG